MNPTDPLLRNEFPDDERGVRALAEAFRIHADTFEPVRLPDFASSFAGSPAGKGPARRTPWRALAAAAAVAVIAGATAYGVTRGDQAPPPPQPAAPSEGAVPAPPGWHWESTRDLVVQVPDSWGYAPVLGGGSFCRPGGVDRPPFVDLFPATPLERGTSCFGKEITDMSPEGIPEDQWASYIVLGPKPAADADAQADGTYAIDGWTRVVRTIGSGRITLLYDEDHGPEARQVIASATQLAGTDPFGCDVSSPIQSSTWVRPGPVDLAGLKGVTGMSVCQYDTTAAPGTPGLLASYRWSAADASAFAAGLRSGPSGPPVADGCVSGPASDAIVLRISAADGTHDLHVGYHYCEGGIDDGVVVHPLTAQNCAPLFRGRVFWPGGTDAQAAAC
jgi:hypothetical protein